jgi:hypothetical protein
LVDVVPAVVVALPPKALLVPAVVTTEPEPLLPVVPDVPATSPVSSPESPPPGSVATAHASGSAAHIKTAARNREPNERDDAERDMIGPPPDGAVARGAAHEQRAKSI